MSEENLEVLIKKRLHEIKEITSAKNFEEIKQFEEEWKRESAAARTRLNYLNRLKQFLKRIVNKKPFSKLTEKDFEKFIDQMVKEFSDKSLMQYKLVLNVFFKWWNEKRTGEETPPKFFKPLKRFRQRGRKKRMLEEANPEEILRPEEIEAIVKVATNIRDKSFIYGLFDSGCRIGEWLNIRYNDIQMCDKYWKVQIEGKTGRRTVFLPRATLLLKKWIEAHPLIGKEKNPYIWINVFSIEYENKPIQQTTVYYFLQKYAEAAKINPKRKVNPHIFRKARATEAARHKMNPGIANKIFGWRKNSNMFLHYINLVEEDAKDAIDEEFNYAKEKREKPSPFLECPKCGENNSRTNKVCSCGWILDAELAAQTEEMHKGRLTEVEEGLKTQKKQIEKLMTVIEKQSKELFKSRSEEYWDKAWQESVEAEQKDFAKRNPKEAEAEAFESYIDTLDKRDVKEMEKLLLRKKKRDL